jgi:hypothetical protein
VRSLPLFSADARVSKIRRRRPNRKSGDVDDFSVSHLHEPSVGVTIGFAVEGRRFAVKQRDDRVAIAVKAADGRNERFREAGVEGLDHSVQELVACLVFFRGEGVSRDGPGGIRREKGKGSSRAGTSGVKSGLYGGLVSLLGFRFGGWGVVKSYANEEPAEDQTVTCFHG